MTCLIILALLLSTFAVWTKLSICFIQKKDCIALLNHYTIMDAAIQFHHKKLQARCRVCNGIIKGRAVSKFKFQESLVTFFGVDVTADDNVQHPPDVCDNHRRLLQKMQQAKDEGRPISTNTTVFDFRPHTENCLICQVPLPGVAYNDHSYTSGHAVRKKKQRRIAGPGRGKRCSSVLYIPPNNGTVIENVEQSQVLDEDEMVRIFKDLSQVEKQKYIGKVLNVMGEETLAFTARKLGETQSGKVYDAAVGISSTYKQLPELCRFDSGNFVNNSNPVLKGFVEGCCNINVPQVKHTYLLGLTIEMMYKLRYPTCIAPLSFMRNLTSYVSRDKAALVKMNGASTPGGSYTTITDWLKSQATSPPVCPDGDIVTVFDNDQVVGKTYSVRPNNKVKSSIITNCIWIELDPSGCLQKNKDLKPGIYMGEENYEKIAHTTRRMMIDDPSDDMFQDLDVAHRQQLAFFLEVAINEVKEEQQEVDGQLTDYIDLSVQATREAEIYQTCAACKSLVLKNKRRCTNPRCGVNLKAAREMASPDGVESNMMHVDASATSSRQPILLEELQREPDEATPDERYAHVPHNHPKHPPKISVADPVFVNPNSFDSLAKVLRKIGKDAGIQRYGGDKRAWTIVCCDGLPYHLCMKLIQQTYVCSACNISVFGDDKILRHKSASCQGASFYREFDWVLLKIGGGHYEMNVFKAFMELNWDPFMSDLCQTLSFRSPLAQQSAKRCDDHHKTWAILLAFHLASLKELVLGYVRQCITDNQDPTPAGFIEYAHLRRHIPNFSYMYDQVTKYSQAIVNFRMGMRRNNSQLIQSAKYKLKGLFHGRRHPIYSLIEVNDALIRHLCPPPVKQFLENFESISKSGNPSKGQDFDFILEETNSETKSWIPKGVPDDATWRQVCRNLPKLKQVKQKMREFTGLASPGDTHRQLDVEASGNAWRCRLRETRYLLSDDLEHTSITGQPLHPDLAAFKRLSEAKRANHIAALYLDGEEDTRPVFVTNKEEQEATSICNQTVSEIKKRILQSIPMLIEAEEDQSYFLEKFDRLKSKKKADLLKLFHEIQNHHIDQSRPESVE